MYKYECEKFVKFQNANKKMYLIRLDKSHRHKCFFAKQFKSEEIERKINCKQKDLDNFVFKQLIENQKIKTVENIELDKLYSVLLQLSYEIADSTFRGSCTNIMVPEKFKDLFDGKNYRKFYEKISFVNYNSDYCLMAYSGPIDIDGGALLAVFDETEEDIIFDLIFDEGCYNYYRKVKLV